MIATLSIFHFSYTASASEETSFIITAYYSPIKWQAKYLHGSYEREVYVNGQGTHGASGEAVFEWMLAAPKKYPFGTKIHFEGFGVAEVQDRGWAIVSAGSRGNAYDRIDIWMWYGDAGRERAIHWGRRTVKWKIVSSDFENSIRFAAWVASKDNTLLPEGAEDFYEVSQLSKEHTILLEYGDMQVNPDSSSNIIKKLQELMIELWEYDGDIDGKYMSIEKDLIALQKKVWVVDKNDDWGAGYYGNKTRSALWSYYDTQVTENTSTSNVQVSKQYNLNSSEKEKIRIAISAVKKKIEEKERSWWATFQATMNALSKQIDEALPNIEDKVLIAKLLYIQEQTQ